MPPISRLFIKTGIIYFFAGTLIALLSEIPALGLTGLLLPVYWHMLVMGWIAHIIFGVAFWMFPRKYRDRPEREAFLTYACYISLNAGLILRFLAEPFLPYIQNQPVLTISILISGFLQVLGIAFFIVEIWPRLQPRQRRKKS